MYYEFICCLEHALRAKLALLNQGKLQISNKFQFDFRIQKKKRHGNNHILSVSSSDLSKNILFSFTVLLENNNSFLNERRINHRNRFFFTSTHSTFGIGTTILNYHNFQSSSVSLQLFFDLQQWMKKH